MKKMDNRQQEAKKRTNKALFYSVTAVLVSAIGLFAPYVVICFLKNGKIIFDVEIFKDKVLWTWFGVVVGLVVVGVIGFSIYYDLFNHSKLLNKNEAAKSDIFGDSRFLTDKEITEKFGNYNFNDLSKIETSGHLIRSMRTHNQLKVSLLPKQHALICGVSGDGKSLRHLGVTIQVNAKSKTKPSMLINDIKGELWNMHSQFLKEQGYETILLDLRNPHGSAKLNPINILWKLKKAAEEMKLEMTDDELAEYYNYFRIFKGDISIEEFKKYLLPEEKENTQKLYDNYIVQIQKLSFKDFPAALQKALKRFIKLPEKFNNLSDVDKQTYLYHLFLLAFKK